MAAPMSTFLYKHILLSNTCLSLRCVSNRTVNGYQKRNMDLNIGPTNMVKLKPHLHRRLRGMQPKPFQPPPFSPLEQSFKKPTFNRKLYARFGAASGIDPGTLWPGADFIEKEVAKLDLQKPLEKRIADMKAEKEKEREEIAKHQRLISERMEKMDTFMNQYEKRKEKAAQKEQAQLSRRQALLEEAREFFGYEVSHKDAKFQQMMEWKEEQDKREKRLKKKQSKDDYLATKIAKLTAELNTSDSKS